MIFNKIYIVYSQDYEYDKIFNVYGGFLRLFKIVSILMSKKQCNILCIIPDNASQSKFLLITYSLFMLCAV